MPQKSDATRFAAIRHPRVGPRVPSRGEEDEDAQNPLPGLRFGLYQVFPGIPGIARLRFGHGRKTGDFNQKRKLNYLFHT
jgi:hypothetical protein